MSDNEANVPVADEPTARPIAVVADLPGWLACAVAVAKTAPATAVWVALALAVACATAVALAWAVAVAADGSTKVNWVGALAEAPAALVTDTVTAPAAWGGACT